MPDREKLTDAMNDVKAVENFLRKQGESRYADILSDAFDALALFREQEAVKPELRMSKHGFRQWIVCGSCYGKIGLDDYCRYCGRKVKWE